jgi:hypothetical protein
LVQPCLIPLSPCQSCFIANHRTHTQMLLRHFTTPVVAAAAHLATEPGMAAGTILPPHLAAVRLLNRQEVVDMLAAYPPNCKVEVARDNSACRTRTAGCHSIRRCSVAHCSWERATTSTRQHTPLREPGTSSKTYPMIPQRWQAFAYPPPNMPVPDRKPEEKEAEYSEEDGPFYDFGCSACLRGGPLISLLYTL